MSVFSAINVNTLCSDINRTPKEFAVRQQKLFRFVWISRYTKNRQKKKWKFWLRATIHFKFNEVLKCKTQNTKFPTKRSTVASSRSIKLKLQLMLKLSSLFLSACPKTNTPLFDDQVDDLLMKHLPLFNQTHHEVIDVMNVGSIHQLFQYASDLIVHRTKIRAVGRP